MSTTTLLDLSIGHGPEAGWQGATSACGLSEYHYHHSILRPALEKALVNSPFLSRFWDAAEHPEWRRVKRGNLLLLDHLRALYRPSVQPPVRLILDLHCNASRNTRYGGFMAIYRKEPSGRVDEKGKRLAECLVASITSALPGLKNRDPQADTGDWVGRNLAFTRWAYRHGAVGVILELGFLTCPGDVAILKASDTPAKVASAILAGVTQFQRGVP